MMCLLFRTAVVLPRLTPCRSQNRCVALCKGWDMDTIDKEKVRRMDAMMQSLLWFGHGCLIINHQHSARSASSSTLDTINHDVNSRWDHASRAMGCCCCRSKLMMMKDPQDEACVDENLDGILALFSAFSFLYVPWRRLKTAERHRNIKKDTVLHENWWICPFSDGHFSIISISKTSRRQDATLAGPGRGKSLLLTTYAICYCTGGERGQSPKLVSHHSSAAAASSSTIISLGTTLP